MQYFCKFIFFYETRQHTFSSHDNCPLVAEADLANCGVVAVGADVVGGKLSVAANTPHVLETVAAIAGLSIPLAPETLGRPVGVRRATIGVGSNASAVSVVGWVGEGASREGEDEDLKHSTDTNSFFLSQPMHNTYNLGRHDLAY